MTNTPSPTGRRVLPRTRVPAVPVDGLYVYGDDATARHLARVLAGVWHSLPAAARRDLLTYWSDPAIVRRLRFLRPLDDARPLVLASPGWDKRRAIDTPDRPVPFGENSFGACTGLGHLILIHAPTFVRMPDRQASVLVAHELAHSWHASIGTSSLSPAGPDEDDDDERVADEVSARWGYPAEDLLGWHRANMPPPRFQSFGDCMRWVRCFHGYGRTEPEVQAYARFVYGQRRAG